MVVERHRKGGQVCRQAVAGELHCPLIVRPTSEDVVVGNVFGVLRHLRPHLWLNALLNRSLNTDESRQVWFKGLSLRFWERQQRLPEELLGFKEGRTEPDIIIEWDNPPTTVWIEAKWLSPFAKSTSRCKDNGQIQRGIRTLMASTGHLASPGQLFSPPKRRAIWIGLVVADSDSTMTQFAESNGAALTGGQAPCISVGMLFWSDIVWILRSTMASMGPTEISLATSMVDYLEHKLKMIPVTLNQVGRCDAAQFTSASSRCMEVAATSDPVQSHGLPKRRS